MRIKAEEAVRARPEEVRAKPRPEDVRAKPVFAPRPEEVRAKPGVVPVLTGVNIPSTRDTVDEVRQKLRMNGLALRRSSLVLIPALEDVRWNDDVRAKSTPHQLCSVCSEKMPTKPSSAPSLSFSSFVRTA